MPEAMIERLAEVAIKVETTKGTKVAMTLDGSEAKFRGKATWTTNPEFFDRDHMRATLSSYPHLVGQVLAQVQFEIELRKTAATGTEDAWGPVLRACGVSFTAGTGKYKPTTDQSAHPCLTLYAYTASNGASSNNTIRKGMRGVAGNCTLVWEKGKPVMLRFTLFGSHDPADTTLKPTTSTLHTITHEAAIPGIFEAAAFTWNSFSAKMSSGEFDLGAEVQPRDDVNATNGIAHFAVVDRAPKIKLDPELTVVSDQDWWGQMNRGDEVAVAWQISQPAANGVLARTIAFAAPKAQITGLTHGSRNRVATLGLDAALRGDTEPGDNEWELTITGS